MTTTYYVYVLKSKIANWYYVGFTFDINRRLKQHDKGEVRSTKKYRPFILVFVQEVNDRVQARNFEKYLKVRWNKESLIDLFEPGWRNGIRAGLKIL